MDLDLEGRDEAMFRGDLFRVLGAAMDLDLEGRDEAPELGRSLSQSGAPQWISTWRVETSSGRSSRPLPPWPPQWISTWRVETSGRA